MKTLIDKQEAIKAIYDCFPQLRQISEAEYVLSGIQETHIITCAECKKKSKDAFGMLWCDKIYPCLVKPDGFCNEGEV